MPTHGNRLAAESSPYLRQHAENPVDWYAWGPEALDAAKTRGVPILLSIGYSACHWCHVMAHESFESAEIAAQMNELFVNVKVDREERPDLDQIYQRVVQVMGGHGGWPLTVFLTPDRKPFFAGTYFPPTARQGMPGFPSVLRMVHEAFRDRRSEIEGSAEAITEAIAETLSTQSSDSDLPRDIAQEAARKLGTRVDAERGGFGSRPKFPNTMALSILLRASQKPGDHTHRASVVRALDAMQDGGIHDQLGGGFHRYCVDDRWLVPHFEKMLYDNALLSRLYTDAARAFRDPAYEATARATLDYLLRDMRAPSGGFFSSEDADSVPEGVEGRAHAEEGAFFVWTPDAIRHVVGDDAPLICRRFGVGDQGNFEHGTSVLSRKVAIPTLAKEFDKSVPEVEAILARAVPALFEQREKRPRPFRDEKILACWNGLAIGAFAEAAGAFDAPKYRETAIGGLRFVRDALLSDGALRRVFADGSAKIAGFLDDHAELACAAIDVFELSGEVFALEMAERLVEAAIEKFWDDPTASFFFASRDATDLVVRPRDAYDNAVPSGASSMIHALLRLAELSGRDRWGAIAERAMRALAADAQANPFGFGHLLGAMDRFVEGATEITVLGNVHENRTSTLRHAIYAEYVPNRSLRTISAGDPTLGGKLSSLLPSDAYKTDDPTAYICRRGVCSLPIRDPESLASALRPAR